MGCGSHMIGCVLVLAALLQGATAATTYTVLDSTGWVAPPLIDVTYKTWAASKNFEIGDSLLFNFTTGQHDVAQVTQTAYDNCNTTDTLTTVPTCPVIIYLDYTGVHYYICTFDQHCAKGQKLAVTVSASSAKSVSSFAVGGFSVALLSIAIAFLY